VDSQDISDSAADKGHATASFLDVDGVPSSEHSTLPKALIKPIDDHIILVPKITTKMPDIANDVQHDSAGIKGHQSNGHCDQRSPFLTQDSNINAPLTSRPLDFNNTTSYMNGNSGINLDAEIRYEQTLLSPGPMLLPQERLTERYAL